jgi:hypothetical protein
MAPAAPSPARRRDLVVWLAVLIGIPLAGLVTAALLQAQAGPTVATVVRGAAIVATGFWLILGIGRLAGPDAAWPTAGVHAALLGGGLLVAEAIARLAGTAPAVAVAGGAAGASAWWIWRVLRAAPRWRGAGTAVAAMLAAACLVWFLVQHGWLLMATGLAGIVGMTAGCGLGLAAIRAAVGGPGPIAAVARAVVDEAVQMRATIPLLIVLVVLVPTLPLVLDHSERLQYRVQFVLSWALGGTSLILSVLTIVLACGSVCGDIESRRIHMTLVKPLQRWQYLLGKWVGIVLFDLLLVVVAGAGTYTFVSVLAATEASDAADRTTLDREVLTSRVATAPLPSDPEGRDAAIAASIDRQEKDDPDAFARNPAAARRRIRQEYDWQWHTVTADMVSTFVFHGLGDARRRAADDPEATIQLQLRPRAYNVDVDLADVRFALWLNDRPWPVVDGQHLEQTLRTLAVTVLDLPAAEITEDGVLTVTVANRNLVPAGETTPTAITFSPGDGMRVYHRVGGFAGNFLRALVVMWVKLSMLAAVGIAAASGLGFPMAILASLVVYAAALGSGFLRDALGRYNVVSVSWLAALAERLQATLEYALRLQFYEAFRMLYGFVTDAVLWLIPSFSDFDAVGSLATGTAIDGATLVACVWRIGLLAPFVLGIIAWLTFDRRDLAGSTP